MDQRSMQAIVIVAPHDTDLRTVPIAPLSAGEALIRTAYVGICATDFTLLDGHTTRIHYPHIPGHEWSGVVEAVGSQADEGLVGCRVVGSNLLTCGRCRSCHRGQWNLCPAAQEIGFERPGAYGQYFVTRASLLRVLPESVSLQDACLIEPTAVCLHAVERARIEAGDGVVVFGDGPIGLISLQLAQLQGASSVIVVGGSDGRLAVARHLGAAVTINYLQTDDVRAALARPQPRMDVAIEASGNPSALETALATLAPGGRLGILGDYGDAAIPVAPTDIIHRNLTLVGSSASPGTWDSALDLVGAGRVRLAPLISAVYPLDEWRTALDVARTHRDGAVKVVVCMNAKE